MNVLKVKIRAQRIRYEVMKVSFNETDLQKAKGYKCVNKGNSLYFTDNKLDILRDYETFDTTIAGVAIHPIREIDYELGNIKGVVARDNVFSAINHPILTTIRNINNGDGMTLLNADMYYDNNSIFEYTIEIGDRELDASLFEIITISCPITGEEHIVELRYDGKTMKGGAEGLPYRGEPLSRKSMLTVPKDYADALGLGESRKLENIMRFDDFINEESKKDGKKPVNKVKSMKDFMQISEDYIHSFINEHERDHEPEEEE